MKFVLTQGWYTFTAVLLLYLLVRGWGMHSKSDRLKVGPLANGAITRIISIITTCLALSGFAAGETQSKLRIAFVGDSVAGGYWDGVARLVSQDTCLRTHLEVVNFTKDSTGLLRERYVDWATEVRRIGSRFKPQIFVISVGTNDLDPDAAYIDRITAVLRSAVASSARMLWIGLPAMRETIFDRNGRQKNKLFDEAITQFASKDIRYLQPWKLHDTETDKFASYGPDERGRMVLLRMPDGTHFTAAGNLQTGAYLLSKIVTQLTEADLNPCAKGQAKVQ
jgi:hypothetical protein